MGHIWGERLTTDVYGESTFRRGFDLLRGRVKPQSFTASIAPHPDEWFMPPMSMGTALSMAEESPLDVWAYATGFDAVSDILGILGSDPQQWNPVLLYDFCLKAQVHPASLIPHENGIALPLAVVNALQMALMDRGVSEVDRKIALNALQVESKNAHNIVMQAPIIVQLALTARHWCNYMAGCEGEHDPFMTNIGQKMAHDFFAAALTQAEDDFSGRPSVWACLPGMRVTLQELAESNFLQHQKAVTDYNKMALQRSSLGLALFGPANFQDFARQMYDRCAGSAAGNFKDYFNNLAYAAVVEPEALIPAGLSPDAYWRAPKMGFQDVSDMALNFVRLQEKITGTMQAEMQMQMQRPILERVTKLVEGAHDLTASDRAQLDRTILSAFRNLEEINGNAMGFYPIELELIMPTPDRVKISGPVAAQ